MKLETAVLWAKGICFLLIGVFTPWGAALAQWIGSDQWPSKIIWVGVILPASVLGGATSILSFLSSSFSDYKRAKDAAQNPVDTTKTPTQTAPP